MPLPANRIWTLMARKLTNEISVEELQELEQLLRNHPDEHYAVEIITEQWKQTPKTDIPSLEKKFEKIWETIQLQEINNLNSTENKVLEIGQDKSGSKKIIWFSLAAASIIGLSLFIVSQFLNTASQKIATVAPYEISTKYGSKTKLLLPDSTVVWLNSGSKLTYDNNYGKTVREVKLVGEAYFDVVKNAAKPFIIHTDKMDIKVLGTAFNVKCYPGEKTMETSLIHGSIEVTLKTRQSEKIILKPNEKLVLSNENHYQSSPQNKNDTGTRSTAIEPQALVSITPVTYTTTENAIIETAWLQNKLVFNKETFEDLALRMDRWYGVSISFKDERLRKTRITGTFENETVQQALDALRYTTKFNYTIKKNEITIF
jgi:transmembrane sensor